MDDFKESINVEEIMAEVRKEIKEKGYKNDDITFEEVKSSYFSEDVSLFQERARGIWDLQKYENVIASKKLTSTGLFAPLKTFTKRFIRKIISFYILPIVTDQNDFNRIATYLIGDIYHDIELLHLRIKLLEEENERLKSDKDN